MRHPYRKHSTLKVGDPIKLVCDLHKTFVACTGIDETLDHFYGWGQLLITDFDDIDKNMAEAEKLFANLSNIMRNFFSPLKYSEAKLRFVFLTGITKFSQISIFSELNNITNISMNDDYAGICGITKEELLMQMSEDIEELARRRNITKEQVIDKLKENYDGYHFTRFSPDIFNPYSLLNCFAENKFGSYWFTSGTPTYLINMMRKYQVVPTDFITRVEADASEFDAPTENMPTIMPLLYQSGYITIKEYHEDYNYYVLDVPNKEVADALRHILSAYRLSGGINFDSKTGNIENWIIEKA